ncbi:MAG: MarR family winged helix-turn-helix transcriptional regulator [Thermomicrobiales bacterium]
METTQSDLAERAAQQTLQLVPRLHRWAQTRALKGELSDISLRQLSALAIIREESTTLGEIARRLMVTPAVITGLIDRLERRGYVRRTTEPGDRRRIYLALTDEGRQVSQAGEQQLVEQLSARLTRFSDEELAALARGLTILVEVIPELEAERNAG